MHFADIATCIDYSMYFLCLTYAVVMQHRELANCLSLLLKQERDIAEIKAVRCMQLQKEEDCQNRFLWLDRERKKMWKERKKKNLLHNALFLLFGSNFLSD